MTTALPAFYRPERETFESLLAAAAAPVVREADSRWARDLLASIVLGGEACSCLGPRMQDGTCCAIDCDGRSRFLRLIGEAGPLDAKSILQCHAALLGRPKSRFRDKVALVGVRSPDGYGFVAPIYDVKSELTWMFGRLRERAPRIGLSALVAGFLYYFLHLHPFLDGNGRSSRLLLSRFVASERGVGQLAPVLFVLAAFERDKRDFIAHLHAARAFDPSGLERLVARTLDSWNSFWDQYGEAGEPDFVSAHAAFLRLDRRAE